MRFFLGLLCFLLTTPPLFAALPSNAGQGISFFRDKNSSFTSGQASRNTLLERLVSTEVQLQYQVRWDQRDFVLHSSQILTELDVALNVDAKAPVRLLSLPRSDASFVASFPAGKKLEVVKVEDPWVRVLDAKTGTQGWILTSQVKSRTDDLGVFTNLIKTPLRSDAFQGATILTYIPKQERFKILAAEKQFIKIQFKDYIGYADITHFVSRADFATLAYHPQKQWLAVQHRLGSQLQTRKNEMVPLKSLRGYVTSPTRGIVIEPDHSYGPPLQSQIEIIKPKAFIWALSKISGHGLVWWKKEDLKMQLDKKPLVKTITTDELMKRDIFDVALEGKNSLRGLVSSNGIYRTEDGLNWHKIELFGQERHAISIHPDGSWFVGSYRSRDAGKTFEPFIRWEKIAQAIEAVSRRNPRYLKINKIQPLPNSRVQISVETGNSPEIRLQALIGDFSWDVVRN